MGRYLGRRHLSARTAAAFVGDENVGVVQCCLVDAVSVDLSDDAALPVVFLIRPERPRRIVSRRCET